MEVLERIGAGRFEGYKLGYTDGSNRDADMDAIRLAATQHEVDDAKSRLCHSLQKKRAVAEVLDIEIGCRSYRIGRFKRQWNNFLPPTAK
jgi:hypothetical protein